MHREQILTEWAKQLRSARTFLDSRGYLEVTTPSLVPVGAFESSLDCLEVANRGQLQTSPEIEMKQILAAYPKPIYQIAKCFRDDPPSPIHRREFTLLEFYRLGADLSDLIDDTLALFEQVSGDTLKVERVSVSDLVEKHTGILLHEAPSVEKLAPAVKNVLGTIPDENDSWSDLFFRLFLEKVEPKIPTDRLVVVMDYPAAVSPLSELHEDGFLAKRFEIYWQAMELCNGCVELRNPETLHERWLIQSEERQLRGKKPHPYPERLFEALKSGLPACQGVAIGLDRLFLGTLRHRGYRGSSLLDSGAGFGEGDGQKT